jgi:hypothetical protein
MMKGALMRGDNHRRRFRSAVVTNPTESLVNAPSIAFANIPRGSVMMAASDVLISFGVDEIIIDNDDDHVHGKRSHRSSKTTIDFDGVNGVVGVTVPAPLSTAKNRGVFVWIPCPLLPSPPTPLRRILRLCVNGGDDNRRWHIAEVSGVMQKPSVSMMTNAKDPPCAFALFYHSPPPTRGMMRTTTTTRRTITSLAQRIDTCLLCTAHFIPIGSCSFHSITDCHIERIRFRFSTKGWNGSRWW